MCEDRPGKLSIQGRMMWMMLTETAILTWLRLEVTKGND